MIAVTARIEMIFSTSAPISTELEVMYWTKSRVIIMSVGSMKTT